MAFPNRGPDAAPVIQIDGEGHLNLHRLTELRLVPSADLARVRSITAKCFGGAVAPEWMPPALQKLTCGDPTYCDGSGPETMLDDNTLPPLPATLTQLHFGFHNGYDEPNHEELAPRIQRFCSTATALRDVAMPLFDGSQVGALPRTVEKLFVKHFNNSAVPRDAWPTSLKHLRVECDNECEVELDPMELPSGLVSIILPDEWDYAHYDDTIAELADTSSTSLRKICIGAGAENFSGDDLFEALPRAVEVVNFSSISGEIPRAKVENLPDSVTELEWPLSAPVASWPVRLESLTILGGRFHGSIDALPNSVKNLRLPSNYNTPVTHWPSSLKSLRVGIHCSDIAGLVRLPSTVEQLEVPITLVRTLMEEGQLPASLKRLAMFGRPDAARPFDLRRLPAQCTTLMLDWRNGDEPTIIGRGEGEENARRDVVVKTGELTQGNMQGLRERDMMVVHNLLTEPQYALQPAAAGEAAQELEPIASDFHRAELAYPKSTFPSFGAEATHGWVDKSTLFARLKDASVENPIRSLLLKDASDEGVLKAVGGALRQGRIAGTLSLMLDNQLAVNPTAARSFLAAIAAAPALTKLSIKRCEDLFAAATRPSGDSSSSSSSSSGFGSLPFPVGNFHALSSPFEAAVVRYTNRGNEDSLTMEPRCSTGTSCNGGQFLIEYKLCTEPNPANPNEHAWFQEHPERRAAGSNSFQLMVNVNSEAQELQCEQHVPALDTTFRATLRRKPMVEVPAELNSDASAQDLPVHTSSLEAFLSLLTNHSLRTLVVRDFWALSNSVAEGVAVPKLLAALQQMPNLRGLDLDNISIGTASRYGGRGDGMVSLIAWLRSPSCSLYHIALKNAEFSAADLLEVCQAAAENPRLRSLNLAGNRVGIAALHAFHWTLRQHATLRLFTAAQGRDFELTRDSPLLAPQSGPSRLEDDKSMYGELKDLNYDA